MSCLWKILTEKRSAREICRRAMGRGGPSFRSGPAAVISDLHSNLEALEAVLAEIDRRKIRRIVCLGDFVGYGASPVECLELLDGRLEIALLGNHDAAVFNDRDLDRFTERARAAVEWSRKILPPRWVEYLRGLTYAGSIEGAELVHANFVKPEGWGYILKTKHAARNFEDFPGELGFFGHSHYPGLFILEEGGEVALRHGEKLTLEPGKRYLCNPGSVGQPRDGDQRASFAVFDSRRREVEIVRVEYPTEQAREKIIAAGLPESLGDRLLRGK